MSSGDRTSNYLGLAAAATTNPGETPQYGLVYDLASNTYMSAKEFRQFARDVLPLTQTKAKQAADEARKAMLRAEEYEKAVQYQEHGIFKTAKEMGAGKEGVGNQLLTGFKGIGGLFGNVGAAVGNAVGDLKSGHFDEVFVEKVPTYKQYAAKGGLLSKAQFNEFNDETKIRLFTSANVRQTLTETPVVKQLVAGMGYGYAGLIAANEVSKNVPFAPGYWANAVTGDFHNPLDTFKGSTWEKAWAEAQGGKSLGNSMVNTVLDPFVGQKTLDRWKRDNPWYQMSSAGTEFFATWYADPGVLVMKGVGGTARIAKNEMPLNPRSQTSIGISQRLSDQAVTTRNPVTRAAVNYRAGRMERAWEDLRAYAKVSTPGEFMRLPMWQTRSRATDGGAAAIAYHWAVNHQNEAARLVNEPGIRSRLDAALDESGLPTTGNEVLDVEQLTRGLFFGDARSHAIVAKLRDTSPAELSEFAPGAQPLLDALDAMTLKHTTLTREIEDLTKHVDELDAGAASTRFHQWEVHTDLADRQSQLAAVTEELHKYQGYGQWLDLTQANVKLARVDAPSRARWSDVRSRRGADDSEQRSLFMDNQFGAAHTHHSIGRSLYIKRAGTAAFHNLESGIQSINRQFDQYEHLFGYAPAGVRDDFLQRYIAASRDPYKQYKIMHELEEVHLIQGIAHKFDLDPEVVRAVVNKIHAGRNETINGILTGDNVLYRTAPDLAARLGSHDPTLQLVGWEDEGKVAVINLLRGRNKQTYRVPKEALFTRHAPEDVTQLPNYYNPLDVRRLYHSLKHEQQFLVELNAGYLRHRGAALVTAGELIGTKFHQLWKPIQLFRLGWPMRVLMDEALGRATAIYGPMHWITGPGAEAVYHSARNVVPAIIDAGARRRHGRLGVSLAGAQQNLGPGPVTHTVKSVEEQIARDAEIAAAVHVPESLWPKLNPERAARINQHIEGQRAAAEAMRRQQYWYEQVLPRLANDIGTETPLQTKLTRYGLDQAGKQVEPYAHPLTPILNHHYSNNADVQPHVYDATNGRAVSKGYVIPIGLEGVRAGDGKALIQFYNDNAEMLSRQGMRIMIDRDGNVTIGRVFRSTEFNKAQQFAQFVSDKHPDVEMWDLNKGTSYRVQDANDPTPIELATYRHFANEEQSELLPGESPAEGVPPVYHGTARGNLPEDLLPRDQTPAYNGRMIGDGLYTTISFDTASSYAWHDVTGVYTIRGSKSGRQYKVFDLDQPVAPYRDDLEAWLFRSGERQEFVDEVMFELDNAPGQYATKAHESGEKTWANFYEDSANGTNFGQRTQEVLHRYLEERHNAGALTHTGGTTHGHEHQVYVWLHPEDLVVKPAWAKNGKFVSLPEMFTHPLSVENVMPESRIIRKGIRNPMIRELRTIAHKLDDSNLTGDEIDALHVREKALMSALGLRVRSSFDRSTTGPTNQLLPDRYVVQIPGHFDRMVKEARDEDYARTAAREANGELNAQEIGSQDIGDIGDFDFDIDSPVGWLFNKIRERHEQGLKYKRITWKPGKGSIKSADGGHFFVPGAYEGTQGQLVRALVGSSDVVEDLTTFHENGTAMGRTAVAGHRPYNPPQFNERAIKNRHSREHKEVVRYFQVYAEMVNNHLGHSPVVKRMLAGQSDDEIIDWLDNTAEGAEIRHLVKPQETPTGIYVDEARFKLNHYLPSRKLQRLLAKGRLKGSDLRKNIPDEELPTVYGPDLEVLDRNRGFGAWAGKVAQKFWHGLGTVPIDALSRHPFAQAAYNQKMAGLVGATDSKWLTNETIERFQKIAHAHAMSESERMLYNLTETTNFNDALRFMSPFWNAQYEAITKWLRIISERPETLPRFYAGMRNIQQNFVVVDEDGEPVERHGGYHPTDRVILQMPGFMKRKLFPDVLPAKLNPSLEFMGSTGIPIGSANTVLQGELPYLPGLGPLVTIPADQFMRRVSDSYGVENDADLLYRWVFPVGRPRSRNMFGQIMEQISPGWYKRVMQSSSPEDDQARINMQVLIGREMLYKARQEGKPDPTDEEIQKAADHMWATRIMSGIIQPFQTQYLPEHQYWLDAKHALDKKYGQDGWDKFIELYGEEAAIFATSASTSEGVPPTAKGMAEWKKNKKLIAKYSKWADAIISQDAYKEDFSPDAYGQQFNITLGPGDTRTLRSGTSLQDRLYNDPEIKLGWREFRKLNAAIEAELFANGLTSIQQKGAEQLGLPQLKRAAIADIAAKYPAWAHSYGEQDRSIVADIKDLSEIVSRPQFDKRPDFQGVRQYLIIRKQVTDLLDDYGERGGSRNLQAQENGALRDWFYRQVGQLILDNVSFAEFYTRYLEKDTLTTGGGY